MKTRTQFLWAFAVVALIVAGMIADKVQAQQTLYCDNMQTNACTTATCYAVKAGTNCSLATPPSNATYSYATVTNYPYTACIPTNKTNIICSQGNARIATTCLVNAYNTATYNYNTGTYTCTGSLVCQGGQTAYCCTT